MYLYPDDDSEDMEKEEDELASDPKDIGMFSLL
jgi:hypothetical protein